MRKSMPKDLGLEMELELTKEIKIKSRIEKAWAAYAKKIEEHRIRLAG